MVGTCFTVLLDLILLYFTILQVYLVDIIYLFFLLRLVPRIQGIDPDALKIVLFPHLTTIFITRVIIGTVTWKRFHPGSSARVDIFFSLSFSRNQTLAPSQATGQPFSQQADKPAIASNPKRRERPGRTCQGN